MEIDARIELRSYPLRIEGEVLDRLAAHARKDDRSTASLLRVILREGLAELDAKAERSGA